MSKAPEETDSHENFERELMEEADRLIQESEMRIDIAPNEPYITSYGLRSESSIARTA